MNLPKDLIVKNSKIPSEVLDGIEYDQTGYNIFKVIYHLYSRIKELEETVENLQPDDITLTEHKLTALDIATKTHRLMKERILIEKALLTFVPKEHAEARMLETFSGVVECIEIGIDLAAQEISNCEDPRDQRLLKSILSKSWNQSVKILKDKSENITWQEDGDIDLLKSRIGLNSEDTEMLKELAGQL